MLSSQSPSMPARARESHSIAHFEGEPQRGKERREGGEEAARPCSGHRVAAPCAALSLVFLSLPLASLVYHC